MKVITKFNEDWNNNNTRKVYHKPGCSYLKSMNPNNRWSIGLRLAQEKGFCECTRCGGIYGEFRVLQRSFAYYERTENMKFAYDPNNNRIYIATPIGFWSVGVNRFGYYELWHRNTYKAEMTMEEAAGGSFHRQKDVDATHAFLALVNYIVEHEKAKAIIKQDYRMLPRDTKKQKMYYEHAKNKDKARARRRVDFLFKALEGENKGMISWSMC